MNLAIRHAHANTSPIPWSKTSSGPERDSMQLKTLAYGYCASPVTLTCCVRSRSIIWPPAKRSLPSFSITSALSGVTVACLSLVIVTVTVAGAGAATSCVAAGGGTGRLPAPNGDEQYRSDNDCAHHRVPPEPASPAVLTSSRSQNVRFKTPDRMWCIRSDPVGLLMT